MRVIITQEIIKDMINDYHNGYELDDLNIKYGVQNQTIQKHFKEYGLHITKTKAKNFSKEELDNIISDYKNGIKPFELAGKYNRSSGVIIGKLKSIGVYVNSNYRFTNDDIEFLKKLLSNR